MPIPDKIQGYEPDRWMFNNRRIGKQTKLSIWPRRCYLSGKSIWFKKSVRVTSMVTGPGDPVFQDYWCDPHEFLIYEMKR